MFYLNVTEGSWMTYVMLTWMFVCQMSLVDLGKRLLEAARKGQDDEVRNLMANGAPFTTDWVRHICDGLTNELVLSPYISRQTQFPENPYAPFAFLAMTAHSHRKESKSSLYMTSYCISYIVMCLIEFTSTSLAWLKYFSKRLSKRRFSVWKQTKH